jgi:hypothetical protein
MRLASQSHCLWDETGSIPVRGADLLGLKSHGDRPSLQTSETGFDSLSARLDSTMNTIYCTFCSGPAHPATGCVYGPSTIACHACTVRFWTWLRQHANKLPRRRPGAVVTRHSFYEAATRWRA